MRICPYDASSVNVEDDPDIAEGLKYILERESWRLGLRLRANLGSKRRLIRPPTSLVILDLMLPGMSGLELCRRLRREPQPRRTPPIIMVTAGPENPKSRRLDLGADDYITKPFSIRELMARSEPCCEELKRGSKRLTTTELRIDYRRHARVL